MPLSPGDNSYLNGWTSVSVFQVYCTFAQDSRNVKKEQMERDLRKFFASQENKS